MIFIIRDKQIRTRAVEAVSKITGTPLMCVEIKEYQNNRTKRQNRAYWRLIKSFSEMTGGSYSDKQLHCILRDEFLGQEDIFAFGKNRKIEASTTKITTKEFNDYIEQIYEFAAREAGVFLPPFGRFDY